MRLMRNKAQEHLYPIVALALALILLVGIGVLVRPTTGAWTAQVTNSSNTLSSRAMTCRAAFINTRPEENFFVFDFSEPFVGDRLYNLTPPGSDTSYYTAPDTSGRLRAPDYIANYNEYLNHVNQPGPCPDEQSSYLRFNDQGGDWQRLVTERPKRDLPSDFTLEAWFRADPGEPGVIFNYTRDGHSITTLTTARITIDHEGYLWFETRSGTRAEFNGLSTRPYTDANGVAHPGITVADGQWHQVAISWVGDTKKMDIYLDGEHVRQDYGQYGIGSFTVDWYGDYVFGGDVGGHSGWPSGVVRSGGTSGSDTQFNGDMGWAATWGGAEHDDAIATRWAAYLAQQR